MDDRTAARAIEWDCAQVLTRFFNALDAFRYDEMASTFAPDGVWHRQGKALKGHAAILSALNERSTTQTVRHVVTNIAVTPLGADRARFQLYLTVYARDIGVMPNATPPIIASPFLLLTVPGSFVLFDGAWLIAEMTMNRTFVFSSSH
jgi:hypothetical protein